MHLNNKLIQSLPDDVRIITEGSGADVKYYAQLGADTASKKQLGKVSDMNVMSNFYLAAGLPAADALTVVVPEPYNYCTLTSLSCKWNRSSGSVAPGAKLIASHSAVGTGGGGGGWARCILSVK